jgi:hypothetical protein
VAEERMTIDQIRVLEAQVRKTEEAWAKIKSHMETLPGNVEKAVIDVCVEDRPTNPMLYPELRWVLDQMSKRWVADWDEIDKHRARHRIKVAMYQQAEPAPVRPKDGITVVESVEQIVRRLRPDLDDDGVKQELQWFMAVRARADYRRQKDEQSERTH